MGEAAEAALQLEAKPGTAQVDFGEAPFIHNGEVIDLLYLVLSFPYSNTFYFQVFQSQYRECFLEGLKRIFHYTMDDNPFMALTSVFFDQLISQFYKMADENSGKLKIPTIFLLDELQMNMQSYVVK
ncbi:hypothetical protein [Paenisporosarcina sp.]|uniref:hypothetical protein n=1 Tax=Paenisporosarcina sp. TaxID=1932001 RepID=UPI003C7516F3